MSEHITIKDLPESERPFERFIRCGSAQLSDAELLAIIINTGTQDENSIDIARRILQGNHNNLLNLYDLSYRDLLKIKGIGKVKAIRLKAVAELSQRIAKTHSGYHFKMDKPDTIAHYYMEGLRHRKEEVLICAFFDVRCKFLGDIEISKGSIRSAYVSPREIFLHALDYEAALLVLIHNHPSGEAIPSDDDFAITHRIKKGGEILEIELVDHIIIGDNEYYSFHENKKI